ncbi:amidase [Bacillus timonensis]|nr:amidase [Bacillus timonensis]
MNEKWIGKILVLIIVLGAFVESNRSIVTAQIHSKDLSSKILNIQQKDVKLQLKNDKTLVNATWVWDTVVAINRSEQIFNFLKEKQVQVVYLQIDQSIPFEKYQVFIEQATGIGIDIHALDGSPNWVSLEGLASYELFIKWLEGYQRVANEAQKFTGIHLDVEPYLFKKGWNKQYKKTILTYQTLLINAEKEASRLNLTFGVDIPFWFDEKFYRNQYGSGNVASWVINLADTTTIMAYRDQAEGENGIIELIRFELNESNRLNKSISIGVETGETAEADYVSFYEETLPYMKEELAKVEWEYKEFNSFSGFSYHYLHSWMQMKSE